MGTPQPQDRRAITVRLPDDTYAKLAGAASAEHRTVSAQALVYIERGLAAELLDPPTTGRPGSS